MLKKFGLLFDTIIHCTKKLAAKLSAVSAAPLQETSPLGSWHAQVHTIHRQNCLLFCHDDTRFTIFLPGLRKAEFTRLGFWFREAFVGSLGYMGVPDNQVRRAELALGSVVFDTQCDRSAQGSLKQMRYILDGYIEEVPDVMLLNQLKVTARLSHYPVRVRGGKECWLADEAMREKVMML